MTCSRCLLPFTADYPEYNPGAGYHEAGACIRGLRTALAEQKPGIAAFGKSMWQNGFDHGKAASTERIAALEAALATLRAQTTPRRFEKTTPKLGSWFLNWYPKSGIWRAARWDGFAEPSWYVEWGYLWLPMPPAPEESNG